MKKTMLLLFTTSFLLLAAFEAFGQTPSPQPPPKVLWIYREDVKPSKGYLHERVESGFADFWAKAKAQNFLALEAASGNPNEVLFISGYDSYAAYDKDFQLFAKTPSGSARTDYEGLARQEAELINGVRSMVAEYREDLSYRAPVTLPQMRGFAITTLRVRPGHGEEFEQARKITKEAHEKANVDEHFAIYEVVAGAPSGTYLLLIPMKSLGDRDTNPHSKAYQEALGDENRKKLRELSGAYSMGSETNLYVFNPRMSYVSDQFSNADSTGFWKKK